MLNGGLRLDPARLARQAQNKRLHRPGCSRLARTRCPGRRLPPVHAVPRFRGRPRAIRSMTRAAGKLNVAPGAISRHVRALEDYADGDAPLFLRRATGLELTLAGETLARSVQEALDRIAEAGSRPARLRRYRPFSIGVYSFVASCSLLPRWPGLCGLPATGSRPGCQPEPTRAAARTLRHSDHRLGSDAARQGPRAHRLLPIAPTVPVFAISHAAEHTPGFRHRSNVPSPAKSKRN